MFKAVTMLILSGMIIPLVVWAGSEIIKISMLESNIDHIKESLEKLESGQTEIRTYIINHK